MTMSADPDNRPDPVIVKPSAVARTVTSSPPATVPPTNTV
jgi:hypothetical protein